jgi:hypothetical protein
LLVLRTGQVAHASIIDCDPVSGGFTVFLSEPEFTKAAFKDHDDLQDFMKRLTKQLDDGLDRRWAKSPNPNPEISFVNCVGRAPKLGGQDFIPSVIETMHSRRVLLEIWGLLDVQSSESGQRQLSAEIRFLLVPMRFAANRNEPTPATTSLQRLEYAAQAASPTPDFVSLIAKPQDIDAFVAAALGFKLLREHNNELAHRNLCYAGAQLQKIENRLQAGRERNDITALRTFVLDSAARAINAARADQRPGIKPTEMSYLALQDPKDACAGED